MNPAGDLLLSELYRSPRDERTHQLAARYAPILRFDAREPFLPVAAGITLFETDGPSPSMRRAIVLAPAGKPAATAAIEYAIWWDWDIHHLYELEHVWVYLDHAGQVVRVEGSWHGKFNELTIQLEDDHPLVLSEPGKHAFADRPEPFLKRAADVRRSESLHVGPFAHVLINDMYSSQIRRQPFDDTLARSYLVTQAFGPAWDFAQAFRFEPASLVPWTTLNTWIPRRVNTWLEHLESTLSPDEYRALRLVSCTGTSAALSAALDTGADGVVLPVMLDTNGQLSTGDLRSPGEAVALASVFDFCRSVPMRAMLELQDEACIDALAAFLNDKKLYGLAPVTAANPAWLGKLKARAPRAWVMVQLAEPTQDPLSSAAECQAAGVLPRWEHRSGAAQSLSNEWIERVHAAGLSIMSWPVANTADARALERQRLDTIWYVD